MKQFLGFFIILVSAAGSRAHGEHASSTAVVSGPRGTAVVTTNRYVAPAAPVGVAGVAGPNGAVGVAYGPRGFVVYGWRRPAYGYAAYGYAYPPYGYPQSPSYPYYSTYAYGPNYAAAGPYTAPSTTGSYSYSSPTCYPSVSGSATMYNPYYSQPLSASWNLTPYGGSGTGFYGGSFNYTRVPGQSFQLSGTGPYGGNLSISAIRTGY